MTTNQSAKISNRSHMLSILQQHRLMAIVRGIESNAADAAGQALFAGGIRMMEITMNTVGAEQMIHRWRAEFDGKAAVGAGTVVDLRAAEKAAEAGAQFFISPNLDEKVIAYGHERDIAVWPGVMTPTEIMRAVGAGADAVKLFPMASLGLGYLREIRAPLSDVPILATGGATLENLAAYFEAGASAVGLGSKLLDMKLVQAGRFAEIEENARQFTQLAQFVGA